MAFESLCDSTHRVNVLFKNHIYPGGSRTFRCKTPLQKFVTQWQNAPRLLKVVVISTQFATYLLMQDAGTMARPMLLLGKPNLCLCMHCGGNVFNNMDAIYLFYCLHTCTAIDYFLDVIIPVMLSRLVLRANRRTTERIWRQSNTLCRLCYVHALCVCVCACVCVRARVCVCV